MIFSSINVAHRGADDFLRRGQAGHDFARAIFAQGAHAHFARARPQTEDGTRS
jgi:hypothetical protein